MRQRSTRSFDVAAGQIQVMATRIPEKSPLTYRKLKDISKEYREFPFRIVAIARGITTLIPGGEDELLPQDQALTSLGSDTVLVQRPFRRVKGDKREG